MKSPICFLFTLFVLLGLPALAQTPTAVQFTWTDSTSPVCTATVTTSCVTGYTLTDTTVAASPVVISSAIAATATTYTQTPLPAAGTHAYSLVANGKDNTGNAVASAPATASAVIPFVLAPPTGFVVTP